MKHKVKILTENSDVGLTLLLWLADYFRDCERDVVITDKNESGELLTDELEEDELRVLEHYDGSLKICCSPALLDFQKQSMHEAIRKAQAILGQEVDDISLDQLQVVRRQQRVRDFMRDSLDLEPGEKICRFLLRIEGFPHAEIESEDFLQFHKMLHAYRVPYLLGVRPAVERKRKKRLTLSEIEILHQCMRGGANIALQAPARESTVLFGSHLKQYEDDLRKKDIWTLGFIAEGGQYNRKALSTLREYYELFCGGPHSAATLGYRPPSFIKNCLYIPTYEGTHCFQHDDLRKLDELIEISDGVTIPVTFKWGGDRKARQGLLQDLCLRLSDRTHAWDEYLYEARILKQMAGVC